MEEERLNNNVPPEIIVKYLLKDINKYKQIIKKLHQKVGESEAYIQELEHRMNLLECRIKSISNGHAEFSKEIKREDMYMNLKNQLSNKNKRIKALINVRNELIEKLSKYE